MKVHFSRPRFFPGWLRMLFPKLPSTVERHKLKIHKWDTWDIGHTTAPILLALLEQYKKVTHGYFMVEDEDVPHLPPLEWMPSTAAGIPTGEQQTAHDDLGILRTEFILDEMMWAFKQYTYDWEDQYYDYDRENSPSIEEILSEERGEKFIIDRDGLKAHYDRMQKGYILFGKYFMNLWD